MAELTSKPSPDVFGTKVGSKSCKSGVCPRLLPAPAP